MVKINHLELENIKKIKAVQLTPAQTGLTIIGGRNNQGKSSVLDAIAWALGGEKYRPSQAQREGSVLPPHLKLTLSNGLVAERSGKNGSLKVTDPTGKKGGQQILNEFVEQLALDLPKFLGATEKEKAEILLQVIGVGERLAQLDRQAAELYSRRHAVGQIADRKAKFAQEMTVYEGVPEEPVSASALIREQQAILAQNGENQRKRDRADQLAREKEALARQLAQVQQRYDEVCRDCELARQSAEDLEDHSTAQLEESILAIDELNRKVRANLDREKAVEDAQACREEYDSLTRQLEETRQARRDLLEGAALPLPGLSVEDGRLTYQGMHWDNLSGSDQLRVATAIVRARNPQCGFVLLDKLEQMDLETLAEFGRWLEGEGLQVIATRVSTGEECSVILEDGMAAGGEPPQLRQTPPPWRGGAMA